MIEKIPLAKMGEKYERVLRFSEREVERIHRLFRKQKSNPPLPRYFPPLAGKHVCLTLFAACTLKLFYNLINIKICRD